jgi:hypothetical protein
VPAGSRRSWATPRIASQIANRTSEPQSRRPTHQIATSAGNTLRFVARAIDHGLPIAMRSVTGTWAWPIVRLQMIGRASIPNTSQPRRPGRRTMIVAANEAMTSSSQIAAATSNGRVARGRNRIASSGG